VPSRWVLVEGGRRSGDSLAAWGGAAPILFGRAAVWVVRFVVVFSPYLYHCLLLFPLFAVLLNCPYPDPPVSASFFPFSSARRWGEGRPRGAFFAGGSRNQDNNGFLLESLVLTSSTLSHLSLKTAVAAALGRLLEP